MKQTGIRKFLSLLLCVVLIAAMALTMSACSDTSSSTPETPSISDATVKGEGATVFIFTVTDADGKETAYEIHTDKTVVGDALLELGLIAGDPGDYGLYVKTVDGLTVDFAVDGKYWAFYVNGEYAMSGVDTTEIEAGATYSFKVEK